VHRAAGGSSEHPLAAALRGRFEGRLVVVEPLDESHVDGLARAAVEGDLFTWLPQDLGAGRDQVRAWVREAREPPRDPDAEIPFAILRAGTREPIGSTRFMEIHLEHLRVEIGWTWLAREVWGTGVNVETKLLLLARAFEHVGCRRVEFKTDARNERSRGALQALGAQFEGILRKHMVVRGGATRDSAYYSVLDDEWPEVRRGLEQRLERHVQA
jgi:RimJ/RimL family protein N-acetyltransferase